MPYVYSTLGQDMLYTNFVQGGNDLKQPIAEVLIRGGAHVMNNKTLITPLGTRTEITDAQHEVLKKNVIFQMHVKNGYIVVQDNKQKIEKVVKGHMEGKDKSAQMTAEDFKKLRENGKEGEIPAVVSDKVK